MAKHLKEPEKRKPGKLLIFLIIIAVLLIILAVILFIRSDSDTGEKEPSPPKVREEIAPENESPSIAIPGYEGLSFAAGEKKQPIALNNPESNTCYFVIRLYLEDGTLLWQSDYLAPGENEAIKLTQPLEAGSYKAVLNYSCFRMNKELSPLNGAETKLALWVK